jgi:uncharacterized protein YjbI with pentapeptide repeats
MTKAVPLDPDDPVQADIARRLEAHRRYSFHYEGGEWLDARGLDLNGRQLDDVYLHLASLTDCRFEAASLRYANLSSATLAGCSFRDADLRGGSFVKAFAHACDFSGAGLKHCNLTRFGTAECDFRHARLRKVRMAGFRGRSGDFRDADLRGAVFIDTTFDGSLMDGAKLDGAAGTLTRRDHVIDVGTPEAPRLLRDDDLLEWFRTAGARVEWFAAPPAPTE